MPRIAARILRTARAERRRIRDTREWQPRHLPPVPQSMHSYLALAGAQRQPRTLVRTWSKTPHHPPSLHHTWNNTQCPLHFLPSFPEHTGNATKSYFQAPAGSILHRTTRGRQEFHSISTRSFFLAVTHHSAHLIDFKCLSRKRREHFTFGSFRALGKPGHP